MKIKPKSKMTTDELYEELVDLIVEFTDEDVSKVRKTLDKIFDSVKDES